MTRNRVLSQHPVSAQSANGEAGFDERMSPSRGQAAGLPTRRARVLLPSLAVLGAILVLAGLGTWQLERRAWKEALLATLAQRLSAAPAALPPLVQWAALTPADDEFRRVRVTAAFENDKEGLVYTPGSSLRETGGGPGYWVFTPARLADGSHVMVNRGFVPEGRQNPATRDKGQVEGPIDLIGVLRWPEAPGLFTPAADSGHNLWFARDSAEIAASKGVTAAPFYLELESPEPPGSLPLAGKLQPNLPNNHLQYAITWFGLAGVFAGAYVFWLFGGWRNRPDATDFAAGAASLRPERHPMRE